MQSDWNGAIETKRELGDLIDSLINVNTQQRDLESAPFDNNCIETFAAKGLLAYPLPLSVGGRGQDVLQWGRTLEDIGYLCDDLSFPAIISLRCSVISTLLNMEGSEQEMIRNRYLSPMLCGQLFGSLAYTEDTDALSHLTQVRRTPTSLIVRGEKSFVTGGSTADLFIVFAKIDDGETCALIIERQDPGVELITLQTHGLRTSGICKLRLHDVQVLPERLIVSSGGLEVAQQWLNARRPLLTCAYLGRARRLIEAGAQYVIHTHRYGQSLSHMNNVQASFGRAYALLEAARSVIFRALPRIHRGETDDIWDPVSSMAKYIATENLNQIALILFKLGGSTAYLESSGLGRMQRDVSGLLCGGDPQDLLEINLGVHAIFGSRGDSPEKNEGN